MKPESLANLVQACLRVERDMSISGGRVPPVQPLLVDVGGLQQSRKEDDARVIECVVHVREQAGGIGGMFDHLEANDAVKAIGRLGAELWNEGVVGVDPRKA